MGSSASITNITRNEQIKLFYLIKNEIDIKSNNLNKIVNEKNKNIIDDLNTEDYIDNTEDDNDDVDDDIDDDENKMMNNQNDKNDTDNEKNIDDNEFNVTSLTNIIEKWRLKTETYRREVIQCDLIDIEEVLEKSFKSNKTPIILDSSKDDKICTFLSYQPNYSLLETKTMIKSHLNRKPLHQSLEIGRKYLVNSMKFGKTLVIRMSTSVPDFVNIFNDDVLALKSKKGETAIPFLQSKEAYFPLILFENGGKKLIVEEWVRLLWRDEDYKPHKNFAICRDEFRVCLTSQLNIDNYEEYLFDSKNLPDRNLFQIIHINYEIEHVMDGEDILFVTEDENS